jgi:hypothetical protein
VQWLEWFQTLEGLVHLRGMRLHVETTVLEINVIEGEVVAINVYKSHRLPLFDFLLQRAHVPSLIDFDWERYWIIFKEAVYVVHLWTCQSGSGLCGQARRRGYARCDE